MNLINNIRSYMLLRAAKAHPSKVDYTGFKEAKSVALIFEAGKNDAAILGFAEQLKKNGKLVKLMAYIPRKRKNLDKEPSYPHFTLSETNWYGKPVSQEVNDFEKRHYEVFISLNQRKGSPLEFLSAIANADLSIGLDASGFNDFNLVINLRKPDAFDAVFKEIDYYLGFINQKASTGN